MIDDDLKGKLISRALCNGSLWAICHGKMKTALLLFAVNQILIKLRNFKTIYPVNLAQPFTFSKCKALRRKLLKLMRKFYSRLFSLSILCARSTIWTPRTSSEQWRKIHILNHWVAYVLLVLFLRIERRLIRVRNVDERASEHTTRWWHAPDRVSAMCEGRSQVHSTIPSTAAQSYRKNSKNEKMLCCDRRNKSRG